MLFENKIRVLLKLIFVKLVTGIFVPATSQIVDWLLCRLPLLFEQTDFVKRD
jgi:hypothetical protein